MSSALVQQAWESIHVLKLKEHKTEAAEDTKGYRGCYKTEGGLI